MRLRKFQFKCMTICFKNYNNGDSVHTNENKANFTICKIFYYKYFLFFKN